MFLVNIIISYLVPIIYDSMIALLMVLFFLFIFRIKDPNIRILFFFLPLIKPFLMILEKVDVNKLYFESWKSAYGIRMPDPSNIIKFEEGPEILFSNPNFTILTSIVSVILILLIIRWISLAIFYRGLAYEEKVGKKEVPDVYSIIEFFTKKMKTNSADVSLTHSNYISPFIVGIKNFTLVLSAKLLDNLDYSEKETLIQHELSHVKRRDNLIGWLALILRDLNFFNPFGFISYFLIRSEQEKACDKLVVKYSEKPPKKIAKDILNSILKLKLILSPSSHLVPTQSSPFSPNKVFSQKRLENRINSIINTDPKKIYSRIFPKILMYFLFFFLLFIQIVFTFKIGNTILFLR